MSRWCLCCAVLLALGAQAKDPAETPLEKPRGTWTPTRPSKEDRKGLEAVAAAVEEAWAHRHLDDATAVMDFPVLMVTDDGKGNVTSEEWTRERYLRVVGDALNQLPPDAGIRSKRTLAFITDVLATVHEEKTLTVGGKKTSWRTSLVCIRKDGRWWIKSITEGGWSGNR